MTGICLAVVSVSLTTFDKELNVAAATFILPLHTTNMF
jgi:hypothetical protein